VKFTQVPGDYDQAPATGMTGDENVIWPDYLAAALKVSMDIARMCSGILVESKDGKTRRQSLDCPAVLGRFRGFCRPVQ